LEKMRKPRCTGVLVTRADPVENVKRHVRNAVVALHQHLHAIFQSFGGDGKLLRFVLRVRGAAGKAERANQSCHQQQILDCFHETTLRVNPPFFRRKRHQKSSFYSCESSAKTRAGPPEPPSSLIGATTRNAP